MRALLPSLSALLLLLLLATPSLAASPLGVDFCSECSLYGSGPFCLNGQGGGVGKGDGDTRRRWRGGGTFRVSNLTCFPL